MNVAFRRPIGEVLTREPLGRARRVRTVGDGREGRVHDLENDASMYRVLADLRIVEGAAFVAAPLCALHLAQLGAEVIRIEAIGGGPDFLRWPRAPDGGASFYWEGLNKGKKSVALNLSSPEGRELAVELATAPGDGAGIFVTNYPVGGFLAHDKLAARRPDMITVRVMGWADGGTAVDYTVNAALGLPLMTGPESLGDEPVNHVLPAWDIATGSYAALALMAAERRRGRTGRGTEVRVPLGDVAMATIASLGQVAEVTASGRDRPRMGNDLFGAFGRDFATRDGRRVMIVALTPRHWSDLVKTLGLTEAVAALEGERGVDLSTDEGARFEHRDRLNPMVAAAVAGRTLDELETAFAGTGVCWGEYRSLAQALGEGGPFGPSNPMFCDIAHPAGRTYLTPGAPGTFTDLSREVPGRAPRLGEHTDEILSSVLGLPESTIGRLHDAKVVAGASATAGRAR
jgi:2-methylfumaryl-CoA isomerase